MIKQLCILILCIFLSFSCEKKTAKKAIEGETEYFTKRRKDGTRSSVNQLDEHDRVHGIRITFYADGNTIYSRQSFDHGKMHGPSAWYYKNGQISSQASFVQGKKQGLAKKFYNNGEIQAIIEYDNGHPLPGLKEYDDEGELLTDYPEVTFWEEDLLKEQARINLHFSIPNKHQKVKYFIIDSSYGTKSRVPLITENGAAKTKFYVRPGETIERKVEIIAEIKSSYGNPCVYELSYDLKASNPY